LPWSARFPGVFNDIKLIHKRRQPTGIGPVSRIIAAGNGERLLPRY
jgi:hypothetical protein